MYVQSETSPHTGASPVQDCVAMRYASLRLFDGFYPVPVIYSYSLLQKRKFFLFFELQRANALLYRWPTPNGHVTRFALSVWFLPFPRGTSWKPQNLGNSQ
jgi:hypothetical protein